MKLHTYLLIAAFASALPAQGDITEVLPATLANSEGNSSSSYPWSTASPCRSMTAYDPSLLGVDRPVYIKGLSFRPNGVGPTSGSATYNFKLSLSTSIRPVESLDRAFENNHGADKTEAFDGNAGFVLANALTQPQPYVLYVPLQQHFRWDPDNGPLLIDIQSRSRIAGNNTRGFDGTTLPGLGRILHRTNSAAVFAEFPTTGGTQQFGLVVELDLGFDVTPSNAATVEGNSFTGGPWNHPNGSELRVQYIYDGNTFGSTGRRLVERLGFRPDNGRNFNGATYDVKVTMSTGTRPSTAPNTRFADNHGADATVVFDGVFTARSAVGNGRVNEFNLELPLTTPFSYNPAEGPLVVDYQLRSTSGISGVPFDCSRSTGIGVAQLYDTTSANASVAATVADVGLVMALVGAPTPTLPERVDSTPVRTTSAFPWNSSSPMRVLYSYDPSTVTPRLTQQISHLSWRPRPGLYGSVTFDCTIDLSTGVTPAGSLSNTFDNNHGPDRLRVFAGRFTLPRGLTGAASEFPLTLKLDRPFAWNPNNGGLIVDIRLVDVIGSFHFASFDGATGSELARIAHRSDPDAAVSDFGPQSFALALRLSGHGCNGLSQSYGSGCLGGNGVVAQQHPYGLPTIPNPEFALGLEFGPSNSLCALLLGTSQTIIDLGLVGAPGCTLHSASNLGAFSTMTNSLGEAAFPLPISDEPSLHGFQAFSTWAIVDATANSLGVTTTQGLHSVLCF